MLANPKIFSRSLFILKKIIVLKKHTRKTLTPEHAHNPLFFLKIAFKSNNAHKKLSHTNNMHTNNSHKKSSHKHENKYFL